ncbi:hypothetical protein LCGC14_0371200 [marine sediment metagenome]|uniref:Uncharacterized protein n=1 Tax=marine sediment metagenome TaxID=412755 RepID=A0A0F9TB91_9ZZZZ|nr:hypothetical protein [Maribacter sp.]HDZ04876.1 hypothetical protein [Maribacter sp.]HEA80837.1 hypothetical protein [Maribacter sp.]
MELIIKDHNYVPGSISFASGFLGPQGDVGFFMEADFNKAKEIIKALIKNDREINRVEMGLDGDWGINSMVIYEDQKYYEYDCYGTSMWAEPIIVVYFDSGFSESYAVWKTKGKTQKAIS